EWTIEQLKNAGICRVNVTTHYKKERIIEHFGNGEDFGVDIRYVAEDQPLGTAGALSLLERSKEPLLVINGDILTHVDFRAMHDFHREHEADMTVAVRPHEYRIPYGVVETRGVEIAAIREKPVIRHFISAGIYLLSPSVHSYIPNGERYDMPQLIETLIRSGKRVVGFPIREYWIDIGRIDDYERANEDMERRKGR
ncbi:MAG: nucleotidyltransferase, partial [Deltaproteobacteria bacterium]